MPRLSVTHLEYGYQQSLFVPLSFTCAPGEIIAILGANGKGKTTLLHTLIGLQPARSGAVSRHAATGFVPQFFTIAYDYSVLDIVLMGRVNAISIFRMPSLRDKKRSLDALNQVGIAELASQTFNTLSGGQKQLVLIARALAMQSKLLILDEPTASLDMANQNLILRLLKQLAAKKQLTIIFTTHDPAHALLLADKTLLLLPEKQWHFDQTERVLTKNNLMQAYGIPICPVSIRHQDHAYYSLLPLFIL